MLFQIFDSWLPSQAGDLPAQLQLQHLVRLSRCHLCQQTKTLFTMVCLEFQIEV
jgi:hypothetical protein